MSDDAAASTRRTPQRRVVSIAAVVIYLVSFVVYAETKPSLTGAILVLAGLCVAFGVVFWSAAPKTHQQKAIFGLIGLAGLGLNGVILLGPVL